MNNYPRPYLTVINSQPIELAFIADHFVFLDHDQRYTASAGVSYTCKAMTVYADVLYGDGLRSGFANTEQVPSYYTLILDLRTVSLCRNWEVCNSISTSLTSLTKGISCALDPESACSPPQYGAPRGFFGGLSWIF